MSNTPSSRQPPLITCETLYGFPTVIAISISEWKTLTELTSRLSQREQRFAITPTLILVPVTQAILLTPLGHSTVTRLALSTDDI